MSEQITLTLDQETLSAVVQIAAREGRATEHVAAELVKLGLAFQGLPGKGDS